MGPASAGLASVPLRDRILLILEMTETFRPSELFALRWSGFDMNQRTLTVSQTAYRGKLRDYGKTKKSLRTVHVPEELGTSCGFGSESARIPQPKLSSFPTRAGEMG